MMLRPILCHIISSLSEFSVSCFMTELDSTGIKLNHVLTHYSKFSSRHVLSDQAHIKHSISDSKNQLFKHFSNDLYTNSNVVLIILPLFLLTAKRKKIVERFS